MAAACGVDPATGLVDDQARHRLERDGANRLPVARPPTLLARLAEQLRSWLVGVLLLAAVVATLVGEPLDAAVILGVVALNTAMGVLQQRRAERSIAVLAAALPTEARVRRSGRLRSVDAAELVVGDVVVLEAGDRIPADGRWLEAVRLAVDESSLTGESVPVAKGVDVEVPVDAPVADRRTMGWMHTTVTSGRGTLLLTATGSATQVGRVATLLQEATPRPTPLQRQLDALGRRLVALAGVAVAVVFLLGVLRGGDLAEVGLDAIALAVAAIPEGLPAVVTLTLALGAGAMARQRAVVRRLTAVETLGATQVVCTDKTGTLTRNRMTVTVLWRAGREHDVESAVDGRVTLRPDPGDILQPLAAMVRCNDADLDGDRIVGDPTEGALLSLARGLGADLPTLRALPRVGEVPFDAATKLMATAHRADDGTVLIEVKGAPDVVLGRCAAWVGPSGLAPLDEATRTALGERIAALAGRGLRTLAVATGHLDTGSGHELAGPDDPRLGGLTLEAIVGMVDPPRPGVADAVATAHRAGVRVVMVTGDHPATAAAIASQLGVVGTVVTGRDLDAMGEDELASRLDDVGVCARVAPEHKVRLVRAFQARGRVVAMTGDGVNDAPALEHADIGVAMGIAGTEVTRQAADLVLTDDDFGTIVQAVERGRTIHDNVVAFLRFQLATNVGAITTILVARLAGLPAPFTALQLLWVNLIMDGPPALALGVDRARRDTMTRPPRDPDRQLLDARRSLRVGLGGAVMAAGTLAVYTWATRTELGASVAVTWAFTTFVLYQVVNALEVRSEHTSVLSRHTLTNGSLWLALAGVVTLQVIAVQVPAVGGVLDTVPLSASQWAVAAAVASSLLVVEEARKLAARVRWRAGAGR